MAMARCSRMMAVVLPSIVVATIHEGDYELKKVDGVLPFTKITGSLTFAEDYFRDVGTNLPHLKEVGKINIDMYAQIELLFLPELIKIGDLWSMSENKTIKEIRLPKLRSAGELASWGYENLETLFVPQLKEAGDIDISNTKLKQVELPALEQVGENLEISCNRQLEQLHLPTLKTVGGNLEVGVNAGLTQINILALEQVGADCKILNEDEIILEHLHLPNLKSVGGSIEVSCNTKLDLSKLEKSGKSIHVYVPQLAKLHLSNLKTVGNSLLVGLGNAELTEINLPKLEKVGDSIHVYGIPKLAHLHLPNLKTVGACLLVHRNDELTAINLPKLEKVGDTIHVYNIPKLAHLHLPNLKPVGNGLLVGPGNAELTEINLPKLEKVGDSIHVYGIPKLAHLHLPNLKTVGACLLVHRNDELTAINLPKLEKVGNGIKIDDDEQLELELLYLPELKTLEHVGGSGSIFETNTLDSKLIVMPKVPVSEVQIFCSEVQSRRKKISQVDLKMKFEAFRIHQQVRSATSFAIVLGMKWFEHFHTSQGKRLDVSTIFPKQRRQGRNLLTMDKSVLRMIFLMLQPPLWHESMAEIFSLVEKYKHIMKENY